VQGEMLCTVLKELLKAICWQTKLTSGFYHDAAYVQADKELPFTVTSKSCRLGGALWIHPSAPQRCGSSSTLQRRTGHLVGELELEDCLDIWLILIGEDPVG